MKMYQTLQDFNRHICSLVNCGHNYLDASHDSKFGTKIYKWFISPTIQKTAHQIELWQITYLTRLKVPTMVPRQKKKGTNNGSKFSMTNKSSDTINFVALMDPM
jgi:hypothetical protein